MIDREKVIKGLACCQYSSKSHCYECPYIYDGLCSTNYCTSDLASDALVLLKEQDEQEPVSAYESAISKCVCGEVLNRYVYPNYCGNCGRKLIWHHNWGEDAVELLKEQYWHLITEDSDGFLHGLPGDDGQYLMTDGKDIWIDDYVDGVSDGIILDSGKDIRDIVAWMHMPELPKSNRR